MSLEAATTRYKSRYEHGVDAKRRISVPSKWRPGDGAEFPLTLLMWRRSAEQEPCLLALPEAAMQAVVEKLQSMPMSDPRAEALRRWLGGYSEDVVVDKMGRMHLPEMLAREAGISDKVLLVGIFDRFEIWNPENYRKVMERSEPLRNEAYNLI